MANKNTYLVNATLPNGEKIERYYLSKSNRTGKVMYQIDSAFQSEYGIGIGELLELNVGKCILQSSR